MWAKLDVLYVYAQANNSDGEALKNWINPGTFNATLIESPAFVALEGFTGNQSDAAIDWNWNPSTNAINYGLDSASIFSYSRTDMSGTVEVDAGAYDGTHIVEILNDSSVPVKSGSILNAAGVAFRANGDTRGLFIGVRSNSTHQELFRNNVGLGIHTENSTGKPNSTVYSLARHDQSGVVAPSSKQLSLAGAGGYLDDTERGVLITAFEAYMDSNGKGVIV